MILTNRFIKQGNGVAFTQNSHIVRHIARFILGFALVMPVLSHASNCQGSGMTGCTKALCADSFATTCNIASGTTQVFVGHFLNNGYNQQCNCTATCSTNTYCNTSIYSSGPCSFAATLGANCKN